MTIFMGSNHFNVAKHNKSDLLGTTKKLIGIGGWKSLTLITIGSICGALNGAMLVLRVILVSTMVDDYVGWSKFEMLRGLNASESASRTKIISYFGEPLKTESEFTASVNHFSEHYYLLGAISFVLSFVQMASWEMVNTANVGKLRERFFRQAVRLDVTWHDQLSGDGDLSARLFNDLECVKNNLGAKMSLMIHSTACLIGSIVMGFRLHWKLGAINLIGIILVGVCTSVYGQLLSRASSREQRNCRAIGSSATEILASLKIVKSFGREMDEIKRFTESVETGRSLSSRKHFIFSVYSAINSCSLYAIISAVTCCAAVLMLKREVSPGHYIGMLACVLAGTPSFTCLLPFWSDIAEALTALSHLLCLTEIEPKVDPFHDLGVTVFDTRDDIYFKNVSYTYPNREGFQVLKDNSFKIPKLRTVAIVGPSGSGKSTIINMILRLFDPDSGKVSIGFTDIRIANLNILRRKIGLVSQDLTLFNLSIEENIRCGNLEATFDDIVNAAKQADAHSFIMKLPNGYKTVVGERGCSLLSPGQKRRIVIARALIRDPDILLLDEATSSLDSRDERAIGKTLESAMKNRTTVVVTQKLSTVRKADLIYVQSNGKIIECGEYNELILRKGHFFTMLTQRKRLEKSRAYPPELLKKDHEEFTNTTVESGNTSVILDVPKKKGTTHFCTFLFNLSPRWITIAALFLSILWGIHSTVYILLFSNAILTYFKMPYGVCSQYLFKTGINLIYLALAVAVVTVLMNLAAFISTDRAVKELRIRMFRSFINQKMTLFDQMDSSPIHAANAVIQKPARLTDVAGGKAAAVISALTLVTAAIITSFVTFWQMTLIQAAFLVPVFILSYFQTAFKFRKQAATNFLLKKASKWASDCFYNVKTIHCLCLQTYVTEVYEQLCGPLKVGSIGKDVLVHSATYAASVSINCYYFLAIGVNIASSLVVSGTGSMDYLFTNSYNFLLSFAMIPGLVMYYQDFVRSKSAVVESVASARLLDDEPPSIRTLCPITKGKIEFLDVSFKHPSQEHGSALNGFNLTINSGESVGLVGASVHGKSTFIGLIEHFFNPTEGKILIDGYNINDIDEQYLRSKIGLVLQEPQLFNATVRENILYGLDPSVSEASDEQLTECCKQADAYEFIMKLPKRFDTVIGSSGSHLSEGQKQKIALARALVRKPKILILEEVTSAFDVESEKRILSGLLHARRGRTTVIISNRLSTVRHVDVIAVIENGTVTERGSHEELCKLKGKYFSMLR